MRFKYKWLWTTFLQILALQLTGCVSSLPPQGTPAPGTYVQKTDVRVAGFVRDYLVHVPAGYSGENPVPLVVVLHGAFSSAGEIEVQTGFSSLADREGFLVLYPNGCGIFGWLRHWNSGHCCGMAREKGIDDVGFVLKTVNEVGSRFNVDPHRIYLVGNSNGGMLAYRLAAEHPDKFAAACAVSATIGGRLQESDPEWRVPEPETPVPMVILHGRSDRRIPYAGGGVSEGSEAPGHLSVEDSVEFWVRANRVQALPRETALRYGVVLRKAWADSEEREQVVLYTIEEWGHTWPGRFFTRDLDDSDPLKGFDAAEKIWEFFRDRSR